MLQSTDNASSADNQQERLEIGWVVGFIDGEGCFSVSLHKNPTTQIGWQIMPEFVATQGEKSLDALRKLETFFSCGRIFVNRRYDNHNENLYRFCVRSFKDLEEKVVPFFKQHPLQTAKRRDFEIFSQIIVLMKEKKHLNPEGIREIISLATNMNTKIRKRFLESSETIRRVP